MADASEQVVQHHRAFAVVPSRAVGAAGDLHLGAERIDPSTRL
jgi:hypothetical protein